MFKSLVCLSLFIPQIMSAQNMLTAEILEKSAFRFALTPDYQLKEEDKSQWIQWIGDSRYVGLAEVHNSAQLCALTKALLPVLAEQDFKHFALEMGPTTAEILQKRVNNSSDAKEDIRALNRQYGKSSSFHTPLIFVNNEEDAVFVEEASKQGYNFWGLDQEYAGSYEMLIDHLYSGFQNKTPEFETVYMVAKDAIRKLIFKNKHKGQPIYAWYIWSEDIDRFFGFFEDAESLKIIQDIKTSWDIYYKSATGKGSNHQRADYMKGNFDNYLSLHGSDAKVLLKMGGVHLTHGLSHFKVDDMGKFLTEMAEENNTNFLSIRHLIAYRNGKSNIGKSGWINVEMFLELGRKDQWTVVDLRPFREMLEKGEITTESNYAFELMSYDLLLVSPDDQYPKVNY